MPASDRNPAASPTGPLARLDRARDQLAKAWLVRLIERASLDELKELPTDRLAEELPALISDVLAVAGGQAEAAASASQVRACADKLAQLRGSSGSGAVEVARDVGAVQGVILAALRDDPDGLDPALLAELAIGVADAVGAVQAAALEAVLERRSQELESTAGSDPLTGLLDLASLQQGLSRAVSMYERYGHPFALLVLDIDGLRRVNESHGRQAGDRVLVQTALAVRRSIRSIDMPARIGNDELAVLAPQQEGESARLLAERLAEAVRAESAGAGESPGADVAIGVVSCPAHGTETDALLAAADQAMYTAKAAGDGVAVAVAPEPEVTAGTPTR